MLPLLLAGLLLHPESFSRSDLHYAADGLRLDLRVQVASLAEVIPGLAEGLAGDLPEGSLEREREAVLEYLSEHYRIVGESEEGERWPFDPGAWEGATLRQVQGSLNLPGGDLIDVHVRWPAPEESLARLNVEVELFLETSPRHRDLCQLFWYDEPAAAYFFHSAARTWVWPPLRPAAWEGLLAFARLGAQQLPRGWPTWLIGLGLLLGAPGFLQACARLGLFAAGQAAGLPLGEWGLLDPPMAERVILLAWYLSVAYLAADGLMHGAERRWLEPLLFGVIHGLALRLAIAGPLEGLYYQAWPAVGTWLGHALPILLAGLLLARCARAKLPLSGGLVRLTWGLLLVAGLGGFAWETWPAGAGPGLS